MEDQSIQSKNLTQDSSTNSDLNIPQVPPSSLDNSNKRKFKIIFIVFFIIFFLTIGAAAAIYTFKEVTRSQKNESQPLPSTTNPQPNIEITVSPIPTISSMNNECVVGGCSGQSCISKDEAEGFVSTCEYSEKYACYETAVCETQSDGKCGWTQTVELTTCLNSAR